MADGKRLVLRGVNVAAYSDDETDSVEQMLRLTSEDDYRKNAAEGFNCVRLNLWATALRSEGGWEWLDQQRAWAASHSLYLILDMHAPPWGFQGPEYEGSFWSDPALQEHTIELCKEIVRRHRGGDRRAVWQPRSGAGCAAACGVAGKKRIQGASGH